MPAVVLRQGAVAHPEQRRLDTTPQGGKMVIKEGCFKISDVDPDIAKVRKIEAADPSLIGK